MLYFNKANIEKDSKTAQRFLELNALRNAHDNIQRNALKQAGSTLRANAAALLPKEAYQEMDSITQRVFTNDEGQGYFTDLMGVSKSVNIGKTSVIYRQASDKSGSVNRSMSGQMPTIMSKTNYTFERDPVPIFTTGYGREWREQSAFTTEGFDAMFDDHENAMRDIREDMAIYMLIGDSNIAVDGAVGRGALNHSSTQKLDLGASGSNIDLTSATTDEIITYFTGDFAEALDDNYCPRVSKLWVSPQLNRKLDEPYSGSAFYKEGTLKDYLLRYGRIDEIEVTFELGRSGGVGSGTYNAASEGNEFFAYVKDSQVIAPLVAQPASVIAIPRMLPMDNVNNLVWGAMGMQVKSDANGRSKVFYASEIS